MILSEEDVSRALLDRSAALAHAPALAANRRESNCTSPGCARHAYAGGLCNAHYIRQRKGAPLDAPIKNRKADRNCSACDAPRGGKGGWGLCAKHYKRERATLLKGLVVRAFGGKCADCAGEFPLAAFDFHHTGNKRAAISTLMVNGTARALVAELRNCELLCANCHRVRHGGDQ